MFLKKTDEHYYFNSYGMIVGTDNEEPCNLFQMLYILDKWDIICNESIIRQASNSMYACLIILLLQWVIDIFDTEELFYLYINRIDFNFDYIITIFSTFANPIAFALTGLGLE